MKAETLLILMKVFLILLIRGKNVGFIRKRNVISHFLKDLVILILLQVLTAKEISISQLTKELTIV